MYKGATCDGISIIVKIVERATLYRGMSWLRVAKQIRFRQEIADSLGS
jgi:hypothetical protein